MKFVPKSGIVFLILVFNSFVLCQNSLKTDRYISGTFWLRHNLVLKNETKVYPNNIEFGATDGKIVNRGEQIKIESIEAGKEFSKVVFSAKDSRYELFVQSNDRKNFQKSFDLAFSSKPISEYWVNLSCQSKIKTKKDVLKCLGFPLDIKARTEEGKKVEEFYYTCWFLNHCIGFDTFWIKFVDDKFVDTHGTI